MTAWEYPNVINIFFVLASVRIEIKGCRIRNIPARFIGNHRDIVAYLVLIRIAFKRIERATYWDVGRPGHARVRAIRVE